MKRRILVTGASKGIGKAIATFIANDTTDVIVHYGRDKAGAEATLDVIQSKGRSGSILSFDISDRKACQEILTEDIEKNGAYYGVVCNAGIARDAAFPALSGADWDDVIHTNLDGFYNVIYPLVMPMIQMRSGGRIVTLSSVSGEL